ncbi:hypothetical protein LYNGBM3L_69840 [Moorena producens 3L]|uniref:Restriction endonuclease n=1 Tax=Moorena producens 3L TaxID=489825 RepID=F4Y2T8_9CYAN|nr:hypothetical protein [Moorena producens]EGJ28932.1 hypothetical protein LYNGBM3L_69840 [Moorena producens 3L]OLT68099.1 hypothetical protein BI334_26530 [Moorena producens 3L]
MVAKQPLTFDQPFDNLRQPSQPATFTQHLHLQPSTNLQPSTCNRQPTFNLQPSTCNLQPATCNLQPSTFVGYS